LLCSALSAAPASDAPKRFARRNFNAAGAAVKHNAYAVPCAILLLFSSGLCRCFLSRRWMQNYAVKQRFTARSAGWGAIKNGADSPNLEWFSFCQPCSLQSAVCCFAGAPFSGWLSGTPRCFMFYFEPGQSEFPSVIL